MIIMIHRQDLEKKNVPILVDDGRRTWKENLLVLLLFFLINQNEK